MGRLALAKRESLARHRTAQQRQILTHTEWPDAPESVAGSNRNDWPDQIGIPGRMTPECANEFAGFDQRRDVCPVCSTRIVAREESVLSVQGYFLIILPMSGKM